MPKVCAGTLALVLLVPGLSRATVDISPVWDSVAFTAGRFRVEAQATFPGYQMRELRVWISGKRVPIQNSEFQQINHPELEKIAVTEETGFPGSAYIEIPFLLDNDNGPMKKGGTWVFFIEDNKFTHTRLDPAPQESSGGS